jgi:hypothetical protein
MLKRVVIAAVIAGAVAGLLDIGAAALINGLGLDVIMRAIARGVLGPAAMKGGTNAAILGLVLQVLMGILIALIYGLASLRLPILARRWITFGLAYGVGIFFVMNYVVVPLSAVGMVPQFKTLAFAGQHMAAMLGFGLICAFAAHRAMVARRT